MVGVVDVLVEDSGAVRHDEKNSRVRDVLVPLSFDGKTVVLLVVKKGLSKVVVVLLVRKSVFSSKMVCCFLSPIRYFE